MTTESVDGRRLAHSLTSSSGEKRPRGGRSSRHPPLVPAEGRARTVLEGGLHGLKRFDTLTLIGKRFPHQVPS